MRCAQPKTGPAFKVAWYLLPENEELSTDAIVCRSNFHCMTNWICWSFQEQCQRVQYLKNQFIIAFLERLAGPIFK